MMKKQLLWMLAAILTLCGTTTVFTSCDDDDVEEVMENLNIVGRWKTSGNVTPTPPEDMEIEFGDFVEFKADGTCFSTDAYGETTNATWSLKDKNLTITESFNGRSFSYVYKIQDGWTRDRMVMTTTFSGVDEDGKQFNYVFTVTMTRMK